MLNGKLLSKKNIRAIWLIAAIKKNAAATLLITLISFFCLALNVSAAPLIVKDAWIQLAPPGVTSHAGYLHLINNNKKALIIKNINAVGYMQVMLHQTKIVKDKVQMGHLAALEIPAGAAIDFTPGAIHLMLMQPQRPQKINDQVSITLIFDDGTEQQFMAPVLANHE